MADVSPIDVQKALGGVDYPAGKADLVDNAESSGAGADVLDAIRGIPDKTYDAPTEVSSAIFD